MLKHLVFLIPLGLYAILLGCQMNSNKNVIVIENLQNSDRTVKTLNFLDSSRIIVGGDNYSSKAVLEQKYWLQTCYSLTRENDTWQFSEIGQGKLVKMQKQGGKLFALTILGPGDMVNDTSILYQSDDEGHSWSEFSRFRCYSTDFMFSEDDSKIIYVLGRDNPQVALWQVLSSTDNGKTWGKIISDNSHYIAGHVYKNDFYFFSYLDDSCSISLYRNGSFSENNKKRVDLKRFSVKAAKGFKNGFYFSGRSNADDSTGFLYKYDIETDSIQVLWQNEGYSVLSIDIHDEVISLYLAKARGIALEDKIVYSKDKGHSWESIALDVMQFNPNTFSQNKYIGYTGFGMFKFYEIP